MTLDLTHFRNARVYIPGITGLIGSRLAEWVTAARGEVSGIATGGDRFDYIIFCAGYGQPKKFLAHPVETLRVNTEGVAQAISKLYPGGKFLFLSSSEIYSGSRHIPHTEDDVGTTKPDHVRACYIEGKRGGEAVVHAMRGSGVDAKIARVSLAYGPGTKKDDSRVLNILIRRAITEGKVWLEDRGDALRGYCYIDDAAEMLLTILLTGKQATYNVGGVETLSIEDVGRAIADTAGVPFEMTASAPLVGAPAIVEISMDRYVSEFGPRRWIPFSEGIRRTVKWQKERLYA